MATFAPVPSTLPDASPERRKVSVQEYLRTSYKPDCDLVDGFLEERNVGERPHGKIQGEIYFQCRVHQAEWLIEPLLEQRVQVRPDGFRVCDVVIARADAPKEDVTVTPPLLCVEVLSPEDRLSRAEVVLADYRGMGVAQSWLLDPIRRVAYTFDERGLQLVAGDRLELAGTPIALVLSELFAVLD